jgi:TetR/AcrR family transcriptional repressor of bet genes
MGPIRREQICRAAAAVIAREGFAGTTMRLVAEEAGVSTGMLNHYFANRKDLLTKTLVFVSEEAEERISEAIRDMPPGRERLVALLDGVLAEEEHMEQTWRVWINSYGEAVRLGALRQTIEGHLSRWFALVEHALEGLAPPVREGEVPWSWLLNALLSGLAIHALTSEAALDRAKIRDEVMRVLLGASASSTEVS